MIGTKKNYTQIDSNDFDEFVKKTYKKLRYYNFVLVQECGNDSQHSFQIKKNDKWFDYDETDWQRIIETKGHLTYRNDLIFKKLGLDGHLEPGNYIIDVCW